MEQKEVEKALDEIEQSKRLALERYKADELRKMAQERENMRMDREARDRAFRGFPEPDGGMMEQYR